MQEKNAVLPCITYSNQWRHCLEATILTTTCEEHCLRVFIKIGNIFIWECLRFKTAATLYD